MEGIECDNVNFFFFQAEDGIRDYTVTGVQTCAVPILCKTIIYPTLRTRRRGTNLSGRRHRHNKKQTVTTQRRTRWVLELNDNPTSKSADKLVPQDRKSVV